MALESLIKTGLRTAIATKQEVDRRNLGFNEREASRAESTAKAIDARLQDLEAQRQALVKQAETLGSDTRRDNTAEIEKLMAESEKLAPEIVHLKQQAGDIRSQAALNIGRTAAFRPVTAEGGQFAVTAQAIASGRPVELPENIGDNRQVQTYKVLSESTLAQLKNKHGDLREDEFNAATGVLDSIFERTANVDLENNQEFLNQMRSLPNQINPALSRLSGFDENKAGGFFFSQLSTQVIGDNQKLGEVKDLTDEMLEELMVRRSQKVLSGAGKVFEKLLDGEPPVGQGRVNDSRAQDWINETLATFEAANRFAKEQGGRPLINIDIMRTQLRHHLDRAQKGAFDRVTKARDFGLETLEKKEAIETRGALARAAAAAELKAGAQTLADDTTYGGIVDIQGKDEELSRIALPTRIMTKDFAATDAQMDLIYDLLATPGGLGVLNDISRGKDPNGDGFISTGRTLQEYVDGLANIPEKAREELVRQLSVSGVRRNLSPLALIDLDYKIGLSQFIKQQGENVTPVTLLQFNNQFANELRKNSAVVLGQVAKLLDESDLKIEASLIDHIFQFVVPSEFLESALGITDEKLSKKFDSLELAVDDIGKIRKAVERVISDAEKVDRVKVRDLRASSKNLLNALDYAEAMFNQAEKLESMDVNQLFGDPEDVSVPGGASRGKGKPESDLSRSIVDRQKRLLDRTQNGDGEGILAVSGSKVEGDPKRLSPSMEKIPELRNELAKVRADLRRTSGVDTKERREQLKARIREIEAELKSLGVK